MSAAVTALVVAIVGVIGTLIAPIISQRLSALARREEFDQQRIQRQDEYEREQQEKALAMKRACYITVISGARRYRIELMRYLYAVKDGTLDNGAQTRLEEARLAFNTSLAETELTASPPVLEALDPIRRGLSESYSTIMNLGIPQLDDMFEEIRNFLLKLWDAWPPAHAAMRVDLGVKGLAWSGWAPPAGAPPAGFEPAHTAPGSSPI
jgi:hypothetical protein